MINIQRVVRPVSLDGVDLRPEPLVPLPELFLECPPVLGEERVERPGGPARGQRLDVLLLVLDRAEVDGGGGGGGGGGGVRAERLRAASHQDARHGQSSPFPCCLLMLCCCN